jgi:hypothetical protein
LLVLLFAFLSTDFIRRIIWDFCILPVCFLHSFECSSKKKLHLWEFSWKTPSRALHDARRLPSKGIDENWSVSQRIRSVMSSWELNHAFCVKRYKGFKPLIVLIISPAISGRSLSSLKKTPVLYSFISLFY